LLLDTNKELKVSMPHPFIVGETFTNRKRAYEVVSIDSVKDEMTVRYSDSGEESKLKISIQARIWDNMLIDEQVAYRTKANLETRQQKGYGEAFTGLQLADFKRSIEGTTWRARSSLGGLIAIWASIETPYTFISWSIYPWPVVFFSHYEDYQMASFEEGSRKAKFMVEVDDKFLYYGFYIERSDKQMDNSWDWPRLFDALSSRQALVNLIDEVEKNQSARFIGRRSSGSTHFHFANGLDEGAISVWDENNPSNLSASARVDLLNQIPIENWGEMFIISKMTMQEAIELGTRVVSPIADLFRTLIPFYSAASSNN
jgi:hypothetical protein